MRESLRKSGIDIVGDVPWGTHFCQFYQTKEDLMDILVPYFKAGLENNELCVWITSQPLEVKEAKEAMKRAVPDIEVYLEKGQMEIIPYTHGYMKEGIFDPERVVNSWVEKINQVLASGYDGLRATGDAIWLEKEGWDDFVEYEKKVDAIIDKHHVITLCPYYLDMCSTAEIIDVVSNHQFALIKREGKWELIENSGRKRAEKAAFQAAKDWEQTFDAVPDLIAIIDTESRVVRANRAMATRLGTTPEGCVGLTCYSAMHGTDETSSFCPHKQLLEDGLEYIAEVHEEVLGGDFVLSVSPIYDPDGKLTGCVHVARDINERKRAEEALREGEERLRFALEISHTGAWDLDLVDHTAHRSLEHDRIFGYEQLLPQWTYEMFLDHVLPEDRSTVDAKFREATTAHSDWSFECRIRRVDGAVRWIWAAGRHRVDATGSMHRMAGIVQDITERKKIEEALRESENRYRMLFNHSTDAFILSDPRDGGRIMSVNSAACRMLGWAEEELIGKGREVMFDQEDPAVSDVLEELIHSGSTKAQLTYSRKDGTTFPGEISSTFFMDSNGEPRIVIILRDITERKKAEETLKKAYENLEKLVEERTRQLEKAYNSLKESEKGLAEAQKMAHIGNWDWNLVTGEVYWSDELYRIFGREPQESGASFDELLNYVHPEDRGYLSNVIKKGLNGKPHGIDYRIVRASGEERAVHAQSEVIFDEKNIPIRAKGIVQDINERKKAEEMLKENEGKLKALFNLLPVGVSITDKDRNILDSNLALENILGLPRSNLLKGRHGTRKYLRSNGTEMPAEEFPSIKALKEKGSIQSSEIGIIKEDGSIIWTDVSAITLPFSDGQVVITTRDITENKKTEEKIKILVNAVESSNDAIATESLEGIITSWNKGAEQIYGYSAEEILGKNVSILEPDNLKGEIKQLIEKVKQGEKIKHYETSRLKKDGTLINVSITLSPVFSASGELVAISGIARDITERKKAEKALVNLEIARKKEIHHRIKNNLQVISSLLDLQAEKFKNREFPKNLEVLEAFRESQDRVISIALIHEELHEGRGIDNTLNFSPYLKRLVDNLFQTYRL